MNSPKFFSARDEMFRAIDACMRMRLTVPTAMLCLAWIDAFVGIEAENGKEVTYTQWCDKYLDLGFVGAASIDLWGARNGMLHSWESASRVSRNGKATEIGWCWGGADRSTLATIAERTRGKKIRTVAIEDLFTAIALATQKYFEEVDSDSARSNAAWHRIEDGWITSFSPEHARLALDQANE